MIEANMTDKTVNARFFTRFFKVQIACSFTIFQAILYLVNLSHRIGE